MAKKDNVELIISVNEVIYINILIQSDYWSYSTVKEIPYFQIHYNSQFLYYSKCEKPPPRATLKPVVSVKLRERGNCVYVLNDSSMSKVLFDKISHYALDLGVPIANLMSDNLLLKFPLL